MYSFVQSVPCWLYYLAVRQFTVITHPKISVGINFMLQVNYISVGNVASYKLQDQRFAIQSPIGARKVSARPTEADFLRGKAVRRKLCHVYLEEK